MPWKQWNECTSDYFEVPRQHSIGGKNADMVKKERRTLLKVKYFSVPKYFLFLKK